MESLTGILSVKKNGQTIYKNKEFCKPNGAKTSRLKNTVDGIDYKKTTKEFKKAGGNKK